MSDFLAEAQVLIRPDTTGFRQELIAQLAAATKGVTVPVPVVATVDPGATAGLAAAQKELAVASGALTTGERELSGELAKQATVAGAGTAALSENAAAMQTLGVSAGVADKQLAELTRAETLALAASRKLALAQAEVVNAVSPVAAAQIAVTRSTAAVTASQRALEVALAGTDAALIEATRETLRLSVAQEAEASTALAAARAQSAHSAQLAQATRGIAATGASLAGLRGATLAASGPFLAATVAAIAFAKAVGIAASTEQELNTFQAVAGATADQMERVAAAARQLGADVRLPAVSAADAAQAMTELAKAGLSVQDSLDAARGTLELAAAAQIDNTKAVELTANALNAFQLRGTEATKVADLLAGASIQAQGSIEDMGLALKQAAAVSSLVGLSLQNTVTLITQLAKGGLTASDAGTSLRVSLLRLVNPTKAAREEIRNLGLVLRDQQGNLRPDVFVQFADATRDMGKAQRDAAAAIIFGADGIRTAAILAGQGAQAFTQTEDAISRMGLAAEVSGARTKGFSGEVSGLKSNLETLGGTIGRLVLPSLEELARSANTTVSGLNSLVAPLTDVKVEGVGAADVLKEMIVQSNLVFGTVKRAGLAVDLFNRALGRSKEEGDKANVTAKQLTSSFTALADAGARAAAGIQAEADSAARAAASAQTQLLNQIETLNARVLRAQIAGSKALERASLVAEQQRLEKLVKLREDAIRKAPQGATKQQKQERESALQDLAAVTSQIRGIDAATAAAAERKANEAAANAKKVAAARLKAQQAVVDAVGARVTARENAVLRTALTEGLADDLKANLLLRNSILAGINNVRDIVAKTAAEAKQKAAAIASLTRQLIGVLNTIAGLRRDIATARKKAAEDARQRADDIAAARVELAAATGNRAAEIAARKARIKRLQDDIRAAHGDTLKILQLRTEIANERAALKKLQQELTDRNKSFKELSFAFLQAQQGFAASLFGNLIPSSATAGLVGRPDIGVPAVSGGGGGGTITGPGTFGLAPTISPVKPPPTPSTGIGLEADLAGARGLGVTQGQFSTLIELTRQMVRILSGVRSDNKAPEARYNLASQSAVMDSIPGHGGV